VIDAASALGLAGVRSLTAALGNGLGSAQPALLVGVGGALGAVTRYAVGEVAGRESFPSSVVLVNAVGSFLAALVMIRSPSSEATLLLAVGYCGSLTTFSTFSFQTVHLWEQERRLAAVLHAVGTLAASLAGVGLAVLLASIY